LNGNDFDWRSARAICQLFTDAPSSSDCRYQITTLKFLLTSGPRDFHTPLSRWNLLTPIKCACQACRAIQKNSLSMDLYVRFNFTIRAWIPFSTSIESNFALQSLNYSHSLVYMGTVVYIFNVRHVNTLARNVKRNICKRHKGIAFLVAGLFAKYSVIYLFYFFSIIRSRRLFVILNLSVITILREIV